MPVLRSLRCRFPLLLPLALLLLLSGAAPPAPTLTNLRTLLDSEDGQSAFWGIYLADARTGRELYRFNADKALLPASNQKVLTSATALDAFGSDHRYRTTLFLDGRIEGGVLRGDLVLRGSGDPSFGSSELPGADPFKTWADSLRARGVTRIEGTIIGDDDSFDDKPYAEGWDIDYVATQSSRLLGVAAGGLSYHDNLVTVRILGDGPRGEARLEMTPPDVLQVQNRTSSSGRTRGQAVRLRRALGTDAVVLNGSVARGYGATLEIPVTNPTLLALNGLRAALREAGIDVQATQLADVDDLPERPDLSGLDTLFTHLSPPMSDLLRVVNKESNNFYADQVFRSFGWAGTAEGAENRVKAFLARAGTDTAPLSIRDGSGLSRKDYVTAEALGKTLTYMYRHPERETFMASLAAPGEARSTLRFRMSGVPVRAKTGSLEYVRTLSGYVNTTDGQEIAFSILANNYSVAPYRIIQLIDAMVAEIANGGAL